MVIKMEQKKPKDTKWFSKERMKISSRYSGQWVAIKDHKIISNGKDIKTVIRRAERLVKDPLLFKIPREGEILIL